MHGLRLRDNPHDTNCGKSYNNKQDCLSLYQPYIFDKFLNSSSNQCTELEAFRLSCSFSRSPNNHPLKSKSSLGNEEAGTN